MNSKYSNFLTVLLILIIIAIVGIIAFFGYKYYEKYVLQNNSEDFVDSYIGDTENNIVDDKEQGDVTQKDENLFDGVQEGTNTGGASNKEDTTKTYKGYPVYGTIEIPKTKLKSPIINYGTTQLDIAITYLYGPGLNQVGVTTLAGHNMRNGTLFSNNKKLSVGDKIFITDSTGKRLSYTIYDKFETEQTDTSFMIKDTQGAIEIALQTCTDDSSARVILLAKADV